MMGGKMGTPEKCEAIIKKIVELANDGKKIAFEEDWGSNSLTIYINELHTHAGYSGATFDLLVDNLYNSLHGGSGLSWAK